MSIFRHMLGLDAPASPDLPVHPDAPLPDPAPDYSESVRLISLRLTALPPARARFVAAFAYLLGRAANVSDDVSDAERAQMIALIGETGGLDAEMSTLVVDLSSAVSGEFGATEDFLVTREFKEISTMEERERLLRCCFVVMAADDVIDETESWVANRLAEELDVERPDLNAIRAEFYDHLSGVRELRQMQAEARAG